MVHVKGLFQCWDIWGFQHQRVDNIAITFFIRSVSIRSAVTFSIIAITFYSTSILYTIRHLCLSYSDPKRIVTSLVQNKLLGDPSIFSIILIS